MDLSSLIQGSVGKEIIGSLASKVGIEKEQAVNVVGTAFPLFISALNKNAENGGDQEISNALNKHDGSIFDNLGAFFSQDKNQADGNGIINHIFGNKKEAVEEKIASDTNLPLSKISQFLPILAPIIMGFIGKQNNGSSGNITNLLGNLLSSSSSSGFDLDSFSSILDQDGDGKVNSSDLLSAGSKLLGGLFKK